MYIFIGYRTVECQTLDLAPSTGSIPYTDSHWVIRKGLAVWAPEGQTISEILCANVLKFDLIPRKHERMSEIRPEIPVLS